MPRHTTRNINLYSELYPASSATIIGAGLVSLTMGSSVEGFVYVSAGICIGIFGAVTQSFSKRRARKSK